MRLNYDPQKAQWQKRQSAPDSERYDASSAKEHGFNYFQLLTAASNGNLKAMIWKRTVPRHIFTVLSFVITQLVNILGSSGHALPTLWRAYTRAPSILD